MDDLAIHFQRVILDNEKCFYKPINVIRGEYDEDANIFIGESGIVCDHMSFNSYENDNFFRTVTNISELRKTYGDEASDEALISEFFDAAREQVYIGLFNSGDIVDIIPISQATLEEMLLNKNERHVVFTQNAILELKNCKSIEEVKEKLRFISTVDEKYSDAPVYFDSDFSEDIEEDNEEEEKQPTNKIKLVKTDGQGYNYKELYDVVLSKIVAQDEAVNKLVTRIAMNQIVSSPENRSHILIAGPTGTGKTEMVKIICTHLNIPYYRVNVTDYTQEGYYGMDVGSMIAGLINACNQDINKAQNGILVIDEIDKKASNQNHHEASNKAVQDSLLKIMGKDIMQVDIGKGSQKNIVDFDTSKLTVILLGAFEGINELANKSSNMGFGNSLKTENKINKLQPNDFIKYGMTPELIGRVSCIIQTKPYTEEDYIKIMYASETSPLKQKKELYEKEFNIKFYSTSGYVRGMAKKAVKMGKGVRGLNSAIIETLESIDQAIMKNGKKPKYLKLTKQTVDNPKKYYVE